MDANPGPSAPRLACRAMPPETFFIHDVHLFDPSLALDSQGDLLVEGGKIAALGAGLRRPTGVEVLDDLSGCWVLPGFVDPHVHLRTPGYEYKEDLTTGSLAAAAGGYVTVVAMANTDPVVDSGPLAAWVLEEAAKQSLVRVAQVGAVSKGLDGLELAGLRELIDSGVIAFSDDGHPISDADLLVHALRYLRGCSRPVLLHLEDRSLAVDGVMHEGRWSARLGLRGIPSVCESGELARDLQIVKQMSAESASILASAGEARVDTSSTPVHFQHLSAAESVDLMRRAKADGLSVTCEVTPIHLTFTDERLAGFDSSLRVNPPIRSADDRSALVEALVDGTIDCIGTDHAPHAPHEKEVPLEDAPPGSIGLETAFAALHTHLVLTGKLTLGRLVESMSGAPSRVLGLEPPRLAIGAGADFCVADLNESWLVTRESLKSKSRNSAFLGEYLTGKVRLTVVDGARRYAGAGGGL